MLCLPHVVYLLYLNEPHRKSDDAEKCSKLHTNFEMRTKITKVHKVFESHSESQSSRLLRT